MGAEPEATAASHPSDGREWLRHHGLNQLDSDECALRIAAMGPGDLYEAVVLFHVARHFVVLSHVAMQEGGVEPNAFDEIRARLGDFRWAYLCRTGAYNEFRGTLDESGVGAAASLAREFAETDPISWIFDGSDAGRRVLSLDSSCVDALRSIETNQASAARPPSDDGYATMLWLGHNCLSLSQEEIVNVIEELPSGPYRAGLLVFTESEARAAIFRGLSQCRPAH